MKKIIYIVLCLGLIMTSPSLFCMEKRGSGQELSPKEQELTPKEQEQQACLNLLQKLNGKLKAREEAAQQRREKEGKEWQEQQAAKKFRTDSTKDRRVKRRIRTAKKVVEGYEKVSDTSNSLSSD